MDRRLKFENDRRRRATQSEGCQIATMTDAGWGDLFAKAAGLDDIPMSSEKISTDGRKQIQASASRISSVQRGRKRRRRSIAEGDVSTDHSDAFSKMLGGRTQEVDSSDPWPYWMSLELSMSKNSMCKGWKAEEDRRRYASCSNCGTSALYHRLVVNKKCIDDEGKKSWPFHFYVALRNIRCCAKFIALSDRYSEATHYLDSLRDQESQLDEFAHLIPSQLHPEEGSLILSKLQQVELSLQKLLRTVENSPKKQLTSGNLERNLLIFLETAARVIIACDALYYRLYYLQIARRLPVWRCQRNGISSINFLPHPTLYFGLDFHTMDIRRSAVAGEVWLQGSTDASAAIFDPVLSQLKDYEKVGSSASVASENGGKHALLQIHWCRLHEAITIFVASGWMRLPRVKKQVVQSLVTTTTNETAKDIHSHHETPAPSILVEWRDSCRDFMCNLYAYATLSSENLTNISKVLLDLNLAGGIVEVGAGTGYIAKILQRRTIQVEACDLYPTDRSEKTQNEYHGATPSFVSVAKSTNLSLKNSRDKALLLCYPPPDSPMAYDTLQDYSRAGGKCLIHIGEFKGLTGNAKFERLLAGHWNCILRDPCLTWGSDASHVSVWVKMDDPDQLRTSLPSSRWLLPCSYCQSREASRRCRLARAIVYCSKSCFEKDSLVRKHRLRLNMIEMDENVLNFEDERHFLPL